MMRFLPSSRLLLAAVTVLPALIPSVLSQRVLSTSSLDNCDVNRGFSAKLFNLKFFPDNNTALVDIDAVSSINGNVLFDIEVIVYGYQLLRTRVDPCSLNLAGLCPMQAGEIPLAFNLPVPPTAAAQLPGIAYTIPDLDAIARIYVNSSTTGEVLSCVEASISNGKTVNLAGVKWATAVIAGLALLCAAVVSGLGHLNTSAHIAANALALFGYFQAQAMVGLCGVYMPPIVRAWTQDFQWSIGIIDVDWMQTVFTWYQRATGGTAAEIFGSLGDVSVEIQRRSLDGLAHANAPFGLYRRAVAMIPRAVSIASSAATLARRGNIVSVTGGFLVFGIQRVAFLAGIETTNLFMTGLSFFVIFAFFTVVCVSLFRLLLGLLARQRLISADTFIDFRNGWRTVMKGILFRLTLIGFPQITILCMWEFTQFDSPAEVVLAAFFFSGTFVTLSWAATKVIRIARRSIALHRNPAYILFSDPSTLNKWGFLYIQFRAGAYFFIVPVLLYVLVKGMIIALGQNQPVGQAVGLVVLEALMLIAASVLRPWMDRTTNSFNLAICVVNFLNAVCLLIFTNIFGTPGLVVGIVGVVLVLVNVIMSLVLLLMIIIKTTLVFFRKNPEAKYQFMADDRASFMKSQTQLDTTTELDALAATARGEKGGYRSQLDLDDSDSISGDSGAQRGSNPHLAGVPLPAEAGRSPAASYQSIPGSDAPSTRSPYNAEQTAYQERPHSPYGDPRLRSQPSGIVRAPSPYSSGGPNYVRQGTPTGDIRPRSPAGSLNTNQHNSSAWQRGAGYE